MQKFSLLLLLLLVSCSAKQFEAEKTLDIKKKSTETYKKLWHKVKEYEQKGLTKSAYKTVETIYDLAKTEQNSPQIIKSLLYESKYILRLEEDSTLKIINNFKKEITSASFPEKNVLANYLAQIYWQYYQQNRWRFAQRTELAQPVDTTDFRTWDLHTLIAKTNAYFELSLKDSQRLIKVPVKYWQDIIEYNAKNVRYQPALYDILLYETLKFYQNDENNLIRPLEYFEIDQPDYFLPTKQFADLNIQTPDQNSFLYKALKLYQQTLKLRLTESDDSVAIAYTDLQRLKFVYQKSVLPDKDSLFLNGLKQFEKQYQSIDITALAYYEEAKLYNKLGDRYEPKKYTVIRWEKKKAVDICQKTLQIYPGSIGAQNCKSLLNQIKQPILNIKLEKNIPENKPALVNIAFKNVNAMQMVIYKIKWDELNHLQHLKTLKEKKYYITNLSKIRSQQWRLPDTNDYQLHHTEVINKSLPNGLYVITISTPNQNKQTFAYQTFQVTDIALMQIKNNQPDTNFFVYNRNNGKALSNGFVKIKNIDYPRNDTITIEHKIDKTGFFSLPMPKNNHRYIQYWFTIHYSGNKKAYFKSYIQPSSHFIKPKGFKTAFIFTDRAIYRPGQTIYFKAICLYKKIKNSNIISGEPVVVELFDTNHKKIASKKLKTNAYGSIYGEFILPKHVLNGRFNIVLSGQRLHINKTIDVAAYKRPKFVVQLNKPDKPYKIGDTIIIHGKAESYAGAPITEAYVQYNVKRAAVLPHWWFWKQIRQTSAAQEIVHGHTKTDQNGRFVIKFKARPTNELKPEDFPIFNFIVEAAVTDLNAETHTGKIDVKAGFKDIIAKVKLPQQMFKDNVDTITLKTINLNNVVIPTDINIQIYKLQSPKHVLRERPWPSPDLPKLKKSEFNKLFPHLPYTENESNPLFWPLKQIYFTRKVNTGKQHQTLIKAKKNWPIGKYILIVTKANHPQKEILYKQVFELADPKNKQLPDHLLISHRQNKITYKPGDILKFDIGSAGTDNYLYVYVEKQHKIIKKWRFKTDGTYKTIKVPITEKDRGNFAIHWIYNVYNTYLTKTQIIEVPYLSKKLKIETIHFRDKLKPNQNESWSFRITDSQNKPVQAEILAGMYDASLDNFKANEWSFNPLMNWTYSPIFQTKPINSYGLLNLHLSFNSNYSYSHKNIKPMPLKWFGFHLPFFRPVYALETVAVKGVQRMTPMKKDNKKTPNKANASTTPQENDNDKTPIYFRKNFKETAFFYPDLTTNDNGIIDLNFKIPETLTKWKFQILAHTKSLKYAYKNMTVVTQKDLMIFPNMPRFVRQGDQLIFTTKITNLSDKNFKGKAYLILTDPIHQTDLTKAMIKGTSVISFKLDKKANTSISWHLDIPENIDLLQFKIVAKTPNQTDAEQHVIPVLSKRILVTNTLPLWARAHQQKRFVMPQLVASKNKSLKNYKLTLEITSNPAWYAVKAMPYIMDQNYECSEQIFSRFYANSLGAFVLHRYPKIKAVFDIWKKYDTQAFISNLEKNPELKSILIEETPWLQEAENETAQKKRIALLFDLNKIAREQQKSLEKLSDMQLVNGGFPWFKGSPYPNPYITRHIIAGIGHLIRLGVLNENDANLKKILNKALNYLDNQILKDYRELLKHTPTKKRDQILTKYHPSTGQIHALYTRSYFTTNTYKPEVAKAMDFYRKQAYKYWLSYPLYQQGLISLIAKRNGKDTLAKAILRSLDENSIQSDEIGMYWKENTSGWHWYQSPIETQALLIEAFDEISKDLNKINAMRVWLLKHKQVNAWKTTKQTTEAIYALLLDGEDWLNLKSQVTVQIGSIVIDPDKTQDLQTEAGSGYFKKSWSAQKITPEMGKITLDNKGSGITWGALYWQYFEDLDQIKAAKNTVAINKEYYISKWTDNGEKLIKIGPETIIKTGDLITVRLSFKTDREMEFIHLKDLHASGLEPIQTLSGYQHQDGLGYYQSQTDTATHFFISRLPKGIYVFEYHLRANIAGSFSGGIATLQSMYAPEFSSHSRGQQLKILPNDSL